MESFSYRDGELYAEEVPLQQIAEQFGTPTYVYSRAALERRYHAYADALKGHDHLVCFAVKANSNLAVLNVLARQGAGFDIVSVGELERVLKAGGDPAKVVFSGIGKQPAELKRALEVGIHCFNVESAAELERLNQVAGEVGKVAPISLRVNPDVDAQTHPYISTGLRDNKFGVDILHARELYLRAHALENLEVVGMDCHIGSQLTGITPFLDAMDRLLSLIDQLADAGISIRHLDLGGGLGVTYADETPPSAAEYMEVVKAKLGDRPLKLIVEPGRSICANAGLFLTRVELLKNTETKHFAVVDGAMNDLIRPSLYQAWQRITEVVPRQGQHQLYDVVGPICETGDYLGKERELCIEPGDLLAVASAGAYGFAMSSNYNSRGRAAEVMVDGAACYEVRRRETFEDLIKGESLLPE